MDSAKNWVPYFATGRKPKDIDTLLGNVLQLHVCGVIIHGRPNGKYLFWALPNLKGNANLNLETIRRALNHYLRNATFRPKLHIQFDGASDNLNLTFLAWAEWLCSKVHSVTSPQTLKGRISKADLVMLPLGHTHDDIDAFWRFVADAHRARGVIRTIDEFESAARTCLQEEVYVEQISWVYDYQEWFKPHLNASMKGIRSVQTETQARQGDNTDKGVRYFTMTPREVDGRPAMWYKKGPSHADLYPSKKDPATRMPLRDPDTGSISTCSEGIEILSSTPTGSPPVQPFSPDRMDVDALYATVHEIMTLHPHTFPESIRTWWETWKTTVLTEADAAFAACPDPHVWPVAAGDVPVAPVAELQKEYAEAILYRNVGGSKTAFKTKDREAARREAVVRDVSLHEVLAVCPPKEELEWCTPFWLASSTAETPAQATELPIQWLACFQSGNVCTDVERSWHPVCCGYEDRPSGRKYHKLTKKCMRGSQPIRGHGPMLEVIERDSVVLFNVTLSKQHRIISKPSRVEFWKLHKELFAHGGIPTAWDPKCD